MSKRAALLLVLLGGLACASANSRISASQEVFDGYPPEVQEQIRAGEVAVGFTEEQVLMALGKPDRRTQVVADDVAAEVWTWTTSKPGFGIGIGSGTSIGNVGIGTGVRVEEGARSEDDVVVEFVNGRVRRLETAIED